LNYARNGYGFYPKWKGPSVGEPFSIFGRWDYVCLA